MKRIIVCALLLCLVRTAGADLVYFHDGSVQEGKVVHQDEQAVVVSYALHGGEVQISYPAEKIERIEWKQTPQEVRREEYERLLANVDPDSAASWLALAQWCGQDKAFEEERRRAYRRVLDIDPDNEAARAALGYVRHEGAWMTESDAMVARGYVLHNGQWVPGDQYADIVKAEAQRAEAAAREKELQVQLAQARARAEKAEQQLRDTQAETAELEERIAELQYRIEELEDLDRRVIILRQPYRRHHLLRRRIRRNLDSDKESGTIGEREEAPSRIDDTNDPAGGKPAELTEPDPPEPTDKEAVETEEDEPAEATEQE